MSPQERGKLGQYLWDLRAVKKLTQRQAEEATGVSNAYLSQIETGKITQPSPQVLLKIADAYEASYQKLMELSGHIKPKTESDERRGRLPTFATEDLSDDEEEELLKYLGYIRARKGAK
jgi:HTH-type transcriptional regulator, competence development regulator